MDMKIFAIFAIGFIIFGLCLSECVGFGGRELSSRGVPLDADCNGELTAVLKRENEALVKLQKCTEDNCELSKNQERQRCTQNGYTFDSELDMCYKLYPTLKTCKDAIKTCASDKGRMATLNSPKKVSFFANYMKQRHSDVKALLTGGHYDQRDEVWRWEDGSKMEFTWASGQPEQKNECIGMEKNDNYKWHDFPHVYQYMFLCEF